MLDDLLSENDAHHLLPFIVHKDIRMSPVCKFALHHMDWYAVKPCCMLYFILP